MTPKPLKPKSQHKEPRRAKPYVGTDHAKPVHKIFRWIQDLDRTYLVRFIADSSAGFFVKDIKLTREPLGR